MNQQSILAHVFPEMMNNSKHSLSVSNIDNFLKEKITKHVDQADVKVVETKPLQFGRLGPETVAFNKMCQGHIKIDSQMTILGLSDFSSVRANCCVYNGKWFYEVRLWSKGVMQLGWCTEYCKFTEENGVGDTPDSYGYDGNRIKLWNVLSKKYGEAWDIGDVITCCIDLTEAKLEYFRNGKTLGIISDKIRVGPNIVYYPAVSLSQGDSITLNFGGSMFLYPVDGYKPIQHQNIQNLVKAQCLIGYLERLIPITVDCLKICSTTDSQKEFKENYSEESTQKHDQISNQCCCWLIASNLLNHLETLITNRFINESCLIPLLLKFCDISNLKSNQSHVSLILDMFWNLLEKESITTIVDWLLSGIVTLYQCTPLTLNFKSQEKYLYLILAIVKHQKTKLYILENALFDKLRLPVLMHIRTPSDEILDKLLPGNYWGYSVCVPDDCPKHKSIEHLPLREEFTSSELKNRYVQSIHLIQIYIRELEDIQSEILIQLVKSSNPGDDETELTLRTLFIQQLYRYLRININNVETVSDYSCSLIMSFFHRLISLIRFLWKETMNKFPDLPHFEDISIPISLYVMPSNNCIQLNSLRISGRLNQLTKTFKTELDSLLNKNFKKSEKRNFIGFKKNSDFPKFFLDGKNKKSKIPNKIHDIVLEERNVAISNSPLKSQSVSNCKISSSPSKENSTTSELSMTSTSFFSFFPSHIRVEPLSLFTGLNRSNNVSESSISSDDNIFSCQLDFVLGDLTSCLQLVEAADVFYYIGANEHLNKIVSLRNQAHNYIVAVCDIDDRLKRCPKEEIFIKGLLENSLKNFEIKLTNLSRHLAFISATTFSEEKRDDILWLWTTTLSTLDDNKADKLYGFLPTYHIENCLNIFRHITTIFHPSLQLEGLRDCFNVLAQHGMMVMHNYRDKRITQSNLRNQMMKGIVDVINLPISIKCLEERINVSDATTFLQSLLTDWADAMIILEKFWRGDGFAFRYQELPHQQLPEFHLRDAVIKSYEKPNPSRVFQNHLKNLLKENNSVATSFIDLLLTKINWSFSEVVSNMQELNQYKSNRIDRLTDIRFIRTCSLCFDITVSLLRILEMIVSLVPELFVDFSKSHSEMFLDRLYSSISQIFNRCLNKGLFHNVINFKINGLDQLHYFPITIAALGVIVALVLDSPHKFKQISSARLVEIMIKESNFMQLSLENIVARKPDNTLSEQFSLDNHRKQSDLIFDLNEYSAYITEEERRKVELIMDMIQKECTKTSDFINKEDDLCTICYAHQKSVIFKPCDHSSCKNCITYQMMSSPHCFFCKAKINKVEDFSGKDLHIKPNKSSTD